MRIIEQFLAGKTGDPLLCEDFIAVQKDFIAVIDGATSRQGQTLGGCRFGRFAAETVAEGIAALDPATDAQGAVRTLTGILREKYLAAAKKDGLDLGTGPYPAAALLVYSRRAKEIWRVADPTFMVDGKAFPTMLKLEEVEADLRSALIEAKLLKGDSVQSLLEKDPFREMIRPVASDFRQFVNREVHFGFGVIDGTEVPKSLIEIHPVAGAKEIVLASDGYPRVFPTLEQTENYLAKILVEDPLMYRVHKQAKGLEAGQVSHDDRSYIRFAPD